MNKVLKINTDGGARGNPGPSAIGVVVRDEDNHLVTEFGQTIGIATNNQAEYQAVIAAFEWLLKNREKVTSLGVVKCHYYLDSTLVVNQLNGRFRVKDSILFQKLQIIKQLESALGLPTVYEAVPRDQNQAADRMVNVALDEVA
jgi:ribonuclease HI